MRALVNRTREMFIEGEPMIDQVPQTLAPIVRLFLEGGRATLECIEAQGCTTLWTRPALSRGSKAVMVARAWLRTKFTGRRDPLSAPAPKPFAEGAR